GLLFALVIGFGAWYIAVVNDWSSKRLEATINRLIQVVVVSVWLCYYGIMQSNWGRTLGQRTLGLRVVGPDGGPPGFGRVLIREMAKSISSFAFFIGYLWVLWEPQGRAWHDLIAGTRIVRE